jgi:general secretion pathway protein B
VGKRHDCKPTSSKTMSYILDALKRADTERERGAVPGLHTRQLATPTGPTVPGARSSMWLGLAAAVALGGIGLGLWVWQKPADAPPPVALRPVVIQPPVAPPAAAMAPGIAPGSTPALTATPAATAALPPTVSAPPTRAAALPVMPATVKPRPAPTRAAPAVTAPAPPKAEVKREPITPTAAPATAALTAVPLLSDLPEDLRRQVPALTITGAVYSENPAQRLLLVNNLVLAQGALAAPEVKLEEIRARSSVFSFRGTRFRVAH